METPSHSADETPWLAELHTSFPAIAARRPLRLGPLLVALAGLVFATSCRNVDEQQPLNLVLVVVDTLRADYLSLYGGHVRTPAMESLAAEGVTFRRAYSHIPSTGPSHASLFTGRLPGEHGVQANSQILSAEHTTLAERLRDAGYSTSAVVSLGVLGRKFGFHQGFDHYDDEFPDQWFRNADEVLASLELRLRDDLVAPYFLWAHFSDPHEPYAPADEPATEIRLRTQDREIGTAAADGRSVVFELIWPPGETVVMLESADEESVPRLADHGLKFRHLQVMPGDPKEGEEVKMPTLDLLRGEELLDALRRAGKPPERGDGPALVMGIGLRLLNPNPEPVTARLVFGVELALTQDQVRQAYAREIEYVDRQLGHFLKRLKEREDWDRTLVVLTSDHGEELFEHGLRGHVHQVYEPAMHVPLIFRAPGRLPAGRVVEEPVGLVDVLPTILGLLEQDAPQAINASQTNASQTNASQTIGEPTGRSLLPAIDGAAALPSRPILLSTFRPFAKREIRGLRLDRHKYIRTSSPFASEELYDLVDDPGETRNLAGMRSEVRRQLSDLLDGELRGGQTNKAEDAELTDEERRQLEALGYVVD